MSGNTLIYEGRRVTRYWHSRYVLGKVSKKRKSYYKPRTPPIYVEFKMPKVRVIEDDPEVTRVVDLNLQIDLDFIVEMQGNYAVLQPDCRPTFFPNHP